MNYCSMQPWIHRILDLLEAHFGSSVEFVVHDLTLNYEHTIVDIRNGEITGRQIGDTGDILGLQVLRGTENNSDDNFYQNISFTKDGRTVRSSTLFLRDAQGTPTVCIAINEDITKYTEFERVLQSKMQIPSDASTNASLGKGNVNDMLDYLISQAQLSIGKNTALMTKEDKIAYIHFLDEHGAFLITKSGQRICEALSISKYTLYNYLEISREVAKKNCSYQYTGCQNTAAPPDPDCDPSAR